MSTTSAPASMAFIRDNQGDAGGGVHVHMDAHGLSQFVLDCLHNIVGRLGLQKRGHILDANGIATEVHQLLRHVQRSLRRCATD